MEQKEQNQNVQSDKFIHPKELLLHAGITQGMRVADLGCGNGYITKAAAMLVGPEGSVFAADVQRSVLHQIEKDTHTLGLSNVHTVWTNLEKPGASSIPAASINLVCLVNTLFQSQDKNSIIKEAVGLLAPGGLLLIADWKRTATPFGPLPDERVDFREIDRLVTAAGLNKIDSFEAGAYHDSRLYRR